MVCERCFYSWLFMLFYCFMYLVTYDCFLVVVIRLFQGSPRPRVDLPSYREALLWLLLGPICIGIRDVSSAKVFALAIFWSLGCRSSLGWVSALNAAPLPICSYSDFPLFPLEFDSRPNIGLEIPYCRPFLFLRCWFKNKVFLNSVFHCL